MYHMLDVRDMLIASIWLKMYVSNSFPVPEVQPLRRRKALELQCEILKLQCKILKSKKLRTICTLSS